MKNKARQLGLDFWQILTEVPGWPDAPKKVRLRRLLPAAMPLAAIFLIVAWNQFWTYPRIQAERQSFQPLLALEEEVNSLRLGGTDAMAAETAEHAAETAKQLLSSPRQLGAKLEEFTLAAKTRGWEASFQTLPLPTTPTTSENPLYFITARGKLAPAADNKQPFTSLLGFLDQLSSRNQLIDLTRLAVRADEHGRLTIEILLRAGCRTPE